MKPVNSSYLKKSSLIILAGFISFFGGYHLFKEDVFIETFTNINKEIVGHTGNEKYSFFINTPGATDKTLSKAMAEVIDEDDLVQYPYPMELGRESFNIPLDKKCHNPAYLEQVYGAGYINFGIHCDIKNFEYYAILREPVERTMDLFNEQVYKEAIDEEYAQKSDRELLIDFISDKSNLELDNGMVRRFSGIGFSVPYGGVTEAHLNKARANVKAFFPVVGIYRELTKFEVLLEDKIDEDISFATAEKKSTRELPISFLSKKELEFIEKNNELDIQLYEFAKKMTAGQFSRANQSVKDKFIELDISRNARNKSVEKK